MPARGRALHRRLHGGGRALPSPAAPRRTHARPVRVRAGAPAAGGRPVARAVRAVPAEHRRVRRGASRPSPSCRRSSGRGCWRASPGRARGGKFVNVVVLEGDQAKVVEQEAGRLPDGPTPLARHVGRLVARHHARCLRIAVHLLGDRADAEDAVQEALLRAYRRLGRYRERDRFGAWLTRVLVKQCRSAHGPRPPSGPCPWSSTGARPTAGPSTPPTPRPAARSGRTGWRRSPPTCARPWSSAAPTTCRTTRWPRAPRRLPVGVSGARHARRRRAPRPRALRARAAGHPARRRAGAPWPRAHAAVGRPLAAGCWCVCAARVLRAVLPTRAARLAAAAAGTLAGATPFTVWNQSVGQRAPRAVRRAPRARAPGAVPRAAGRLVALRRLATVARPGRARSGAPARARRRAARADPGRGRRGAPPWVELPEAQRFVHGAIDAVVPADVLGRDQRLVLRMIRDAVPGRAVCFTPGGYAQALGLGPWLRQEGLVTRLVPARQRAARRAAHGAAVGLDLPCPRGAGARGAVAGPAVGRRPVRVRGHRRGARPRAARPRAARPRRRRRRQGAAPARTSAAASARGSVAAPRPIVPHGTVRSKSTGPKRRTSGAAWASRR